jgi:VanZ family protein
MRRIGARIALVVLAGALVYVATTKGFPSTHRLVFGFFHETLGLSAQTADSWTTVVRKGFHVPAYALLTVLTWWALPPSRRRAGLVLGLVMLVAVADESLQWAYPGRTGRVTDVLVDLGGAVLGLLVVGAFRARSGADATGS